MGRGDILGRLFSQRFRLSFSNVLNPSSRYTLFLPEVIVVFLPREARPLWQILEQFDRVYIRRPALPRTPCLVKIGAKGNAVTFTSALLELVYIYTLRQSC